MKTKLILCLLVALAAYAQSPGIAAGTVGGTAAAPSLTTTAGYTLFTLTLTASATPTFVSAATGAGALKVCQGGSGGYTVTWSAPFSGFPAIKGTAVGYCEAYTWQYDGSTVLCTGVSYPSGSVMEAIASATTQISAGSGSIAANTCATATDVTATGVLSTDTMIITPNADISTATGYGAAATDGLKVYFWPTAGAVHFKVCNGTAASITYGTAVSLNWRVTR